MTELKHNSHIHLFKLNHLPEKIIPGVNLQKLLDGFSGSTIMWFLHWLNPFSSNDMLDRVRTYLKIGNVAKQKDVFKRALEIYGEKTKTKFVVLPMDFTNAGMGKSPISYKLQLLELISLAEEDNRIIPFINIDPRNEWTMKNYKKIIEDNDIKGIKLYPALGFMPNDSRMKEVYKFANERSMSIIVHAGKDFMYGYNKIDRKYVEKYSKVSTKWWFFKSQKKKSSYFSDPRNYQLLFSKYSNINWCFAHFGSSDYKKYVNESYLNCYKEYPDMQDPDENWTKIVLNYIYRYNNVFTDISCNYTGDQAEILINYILSSSYLKTRILFGSDFYVSEISETENKYVKLIDKFYRQKKLLNENSSDFLRDY